MNWTKARLGELFSSLSLVQGPATVSTTGLESVTGVAWVVLGCVAFLRHSASSSCTHSKDTLYLWAWHTLHPSYFCPWEQ